MYKLWKDDQLERASQKSISSWDGYINIDFLSSRCYTVKRQNLAATRFQQNTNVCSRPSTRKTKLHSP